MIPGGQTRGIRVFAEATAAVLGDALVMDGISIRLANVTRISAGDTGARRLEIVTSIVGLLALLVKLILNGHLDIQVVLRLHQSLLDDFNVLLDLAGGLIYLICN